MLTRPSFLFLFLSAFFILYISPHSQPIVTLEIEETGGTGGSNFPVTFGHIFMKGDLSGSLIVTTSKKPVVTQMDIKNRYGDGSVRFAIISVQIPSLTSGEKLELLLSNTGSQTENSPGSVDFWNDGFDARLDYQIYPDRQMTGPGTSLEIKASEMVTPESKLWLQGNFANEILVSNPGKVNHPSLNAQFQIRRYAGWSGTRVSVVGENSWHDKRGNVYYDLDLFLGKDATQPVFSREKVSHWRDSRWRRVFWYGQKPPDTHIRFDMQYWMAAGFLPPYDIELGLDETRINDRYQTYLDESCWGCGSNDICSNGIVFSRLTEHGGRDDRKLFPRWTTDYFFSGDHRNAEIVLSAGQQAASFPMHLRNRETGKVLFLKDYPDKFPWDPNHNWQGWGHFPFSKGDMDSPMEVSWGYPPSLPFVPYLMTGDYFFMEEQWYWGAYSLWWSGRPDGIIRGRGRENSMRLREVMHAWAVSPDDYPERQYFEESLRNTIQYANEHIQTVDKDNMFGIYKVEDHGGKYENNYFLIGVTDQLARMGFKDADRWRNFMLRLPVGMLTNHPAFNKYDVVNYFFHVVDTTCGSSCAEGYRIPDNWSDFYNVMRSQIRNIEADEMGRDGEFNEVWIGYLMYALAIARRVGVSGAEEAFNEIYQYLGNKGWRNPESSNFDSRDWLNLSPDGVYPFQTNPNSIMPKTSIMPAKQQKLFRIDLLGKRKSKVGIMMEKNEKGELIKQLKIK